MRHCRGSINVYHQRCALLANKGNADATEGSPAATAKGSGVLSSFFIATWVKNVAQGRGCADGLPVALNR